MHHNHILFLVDIVKNLKLIHLCKRKALFISQLNKNNLLPVTIIYNPNENNKLVLINLTRIHRNYTEIGK